MTGRAKLEDDMPNILVRGVPERTVDTLKQRAKRNRRSLQQELLSILEATAEGSRTATASEVAAAIRKRLAQNGRSFSDSTTLVREDRER
jgi:plasmid stability protein